MWGSKEAKTKHSQRQSQPCHRKEGQKELFLVFSIFDAALFGYVWCEYCGMGCLICLRGKLAGSLKTDSVVLQLLRPLAGAWLAVHEVGYVYVPSN